MNPRLTEMLDAEKFALDFAVDWIRELNGQSSEMIFREIRRRMAATPTWQESVEATVISPEAKVESYRARGEQRKADVRKARWEQAYAAFRGATFTPEQIKPIWGSTKSAVQAMLVKLCEDGRMERAARGTYCLVIDSPAGTEEGENVLG